MSSGLLVISPAAGQFGSVNVGSAQSLNFQLSATGVGVLLESVTLSDPVNFSIVPPQNLPWNVSIFGNVYDANGNKIPGIINVTFQPQSDGPFNQSVSFVHSGANTPLELQLTGTGTTPAPPVPPPVGYQGQQNSTPNGGIVGLVSYLPQFLQFTNRLVMALGNGFPPQLFSDNTGTPTNPAQSLVISAISVDGFGVVTVTLAGGLNPAQVGSNFVLAGITNPLYNGTFVAITASSGAITLYNPSVIGQGPSSGGMATVTTIPIFNTFVPAYPPWVADTSYSAQTVIQPATQPTPAIYLTAVQGGTSGNTEPTWTGLQVGQEISDGSIIWQVTGLLNSAAPPPPGASHIAIYGSELWVFNTYPQNTANGLDGPCSLRASNINNPNSWNPINQAFIDKDDGAEGMGLGSFTITAQGIPPEGSLVAFKNFVPYQIVGVFGASNFSIQRVVSNMGCLAPRSILFVPGYGLMRYTHLGYAIFDGVADHVASEQIRPYLFQESDAIFADITVIDPTYAAASWAALTANPPMYCAFVPIGSNSGGQLTRAFCYDMVMKGWAIVDFPFALGCAAQTASLVSNPLTILGGYVDGCIQRWQAGDANWYANGTTPSQVAWGFKTPTNASKDADQRLYLRRIVIRGNNTNITAPITVTPYASGVALSPISRNIPAANDFDLFADVSDGGFTGVRFDATVSGTGQGEIDGVDFHVEGRPIGVNSQGVC
jgi:hypothetical protein